MAQCLDKLTPDAFVHSQWIQTWFWSGSQLMTCLLLLESPTGEPHGDASRYPLGIPGRAHRAGWSLGLSTCALVVILNLWGGGSGCVSCVQFQLCGVCAIPAAQLRCGALQGSTFSSTESQDNTVLLSALLSWAWFDRGELQILLWPKFSALLPMELLSVHHLLSEISIYTWCRHSSMLTWLPAVCCKSAQPLLMTWRVWVLSELTQLFSSSVESQFILGNRDVSEQLKTGSVRLDVWVCY